MSVVYRIFEDIQKTIDEKYKSDEEGLDKNLKRTLKEDFKKACLENSFISISFTTRNFPRPLRMGFIQRRVKEVLNLFITHEVLLHDVCIAIEEATSNIIEHSYEAMEYPVMEFRFHLYSSKIVITIDDFGERGRQFKLENNGKYNSHNELKSTVSKSKGGIGLYLIRKIMDDVRYEAHPGKYNRIIMVKNYGSDFKAV